MSPPRVAAARDRVPADHAGQWWCNRKGGVRMVITDVKVELYNWHTEPWHSIPGVVNGGDQQLGIVEIGTDEGLTQGKRKVAGRG